MANGFSLNAPLSLVNGERSIPAVRETNTGAAADDIAARARGPAPERNAGGVPDFEKNPLGAIGLVLTDIARDMSAVEGRADVACQGLSGPFIAKSRHEVIWSRIS